MKRQKSNYYNSSNKETMKRKFFDLFWQGALCDDKNQRLYMRCGKYISLPSDIFVDIKIYEERSGFAVLALFFLIVDILASELGTTLPDGLFPIFYVVGFIWIVLLRFICVRFYIARVCSKMEWKEDETEENLFVNSTIKYTGVSARFYLLFFLYSIFMMLVFLKG